MKKPLPMKAVWWHTVVSLFGLFAFSLVTPATTIALAERGFSAGMIGLYAMVPYVVLIVGLPLAPGLHARWGRGRVFRIGLLLNAGAMLGFAFTDSYWAWVVLSALVGMHMSLWGTIPDALIAEHTPQKNLGRATGVFQALVALVFAAGPTVIALFGLGVLEAGIVGAAAVGIGLLMLIPCRSDQLATDDHPDSHGFLRVMRRLSPLLFIGASVAGLFETGLLAMGVVHALAIGMTAAAAAMIVTTIGLGSFLTQFPAGALADRFAVITLARTVGLILLVSSPLLLLTPAIPWLLWPLALLWGAVGGTLQTLMYIEVGRTREQASASAGIAAMFVAYTLGSVIGPAVGGVVTDWTPQFGLAGLLLAAGMGLLVVIPRREARLRLQETQGHVIQWFYL